MPLDHLADCRAPVASALDFGDHRAQFGGERAEQVAAAVAVAAFTGLLQAVGGRAKTNGPNGLCRTFEAVRGGRQTGEVGGAPGCAGRWAQASHSIGKARDDTLVWPEFGNVEDKTLIW